MELVDLGASELDNTSNVVWAQCKGTPIDDDEPGFDYGKPPVMCSLGVSSRPYPADSRGSAQGVVADISGDGAVIAAHDPRASGVYGEIQPGETALHATGPDFDSRALAKEQVFAIVVGNDYVVSIDRKNKKIVVNSPGGQIQVSEDSGITIVDSSGKGSLRLQDGVVALMGSVILGGGNPTSSAADATKVDAEFKKIWNMFSSWTPSPTDGGAALKAISSTVSLTVQPTAAAGVALGS